MVESHSISKDTDRNHIGFIKENTINLSQVLISGVKLLPELCLSVPCFIVFPGPFKSSSKFPPRAVTNLTRYVPSHQYQSSPLRTFCGAAQAGGLDGWSRDCYCYSQFIFWGRRHSTLMFAAVPIELNAR